MKLGLLADIHECVPNLKAAHDRLAAEHVDRLVVLGDIVETGKHIDAIVGLLMQAKVTGVWGNHDMGLAIDPDAEVRSWFSPTVVEYFGRLSGRLVVADCHMSHSPSFMDPGDWEQPWYTSPWPDQPEMIAQSLAAVPERVQFLGHYHTWLINNSDGPIAWSGQEPIRLAPPTRYQVIIDAVLGGWCATYDTETGWLVPLRIGPKIEPGL
jgi:hypothetical protein